MPAVWINSPLTGDQVAPAFNVNVGWELDRANGRPPVVAGEQLRLTVAGATGIGPINPLNLPDTTGDTTFQVTYPAPAQPTEVTVTVDLLTAAGGVLASDSEIVSVNAPTVVGIGVGPPPGPGWAARAAGTALVLTGVCRFNGVGEVRLEVYTLRITRLPHAAGTPQQVRKSKQTDHERPAGLHDRIWAQVLAKKYNGERPDKPKHHYQCTAKAYAANGGGFLGSAGASIPDVAVEVALP